MPIIDCPLCQNRGGNCFHCGGSGHVLAHDHAAATAKLLENMDRLPTTERLMGMPNLSAEQQLLMAQAKEDMQRVTGIRERQRDPIDEALRMLERAMRITGTVVTITTRPAPDMPLRMGCYDLCVETRKFNRLEPFPRLLVELTPPSN